MTTKTNPEVQLPPLPQQAHTAVPSDMPVSQQQAITPMDMLSRAIEHGSSVEVMERLLALQERWQANQDAREDVWQKQEAKIQFTQALIAAKRQLPIIVKNREASFATEKGRTSYQYEDLATIAKVIDPILGQHGLTYFFETSQTPDEMIVTCVLAHELGHEVRNTLRGPVDKTGSKNPIQAMGSSVTYLQRYTLKAALGVAAARDDDGHGGNGNGNGGRITPEQVELLKIAIDAADVGTESWILNNVSKLTKREITRLEDIPAKYVIRSFDAVRKRKNR